MHDKNDGLTEGGACSRLPRLLAVGPAHDGSSYSRVLHSTLPHLTGWDVHHLGINYNGPSRHSPWRIHPNPRPEDRLAIAETVTLADAISPDAIFIFNSFLSLPRYWKVQTLMAEPHPSVIIQCPLLGEIVDPRLVGRLAFADCIVALSEGVKRHFEECLRFCLDDGYIQAKPPVAVIPHGFDKDIFYALAPTANGEGRRKTVRELLRIDIADDPFIVLNANKNEPRKRIDITLRGFALFARDKPAGVRLHLHTNDSRGSLAALARELGIEDRVTFAAHCEQGDPALSDVDLNRLYNACAVGINTASGEGWGMIAFEHAATGAAQIVPGHGVCAELWEGCAEVLPIAMEPAGARYTKEYAVSAEGAAAALQRLYVDPNYRADIAARGKAFALNPAFQWSTIGTAWTRLLDDLTGRRRPRSSTGA